MINYRLPVKIREKQQIEFFSTDVHSSLHHQGAYACVEACLQQVLGSVCQHDSATSTVHLTEQDDGGQRKLLNKKTRKSNPLLVCLFFPPTRQCEEYSTILTCPAVCMERMLESADRKPMASVLGYSPFSNTYMFSVNWAPSNMTQLTHKDTHTLLLSYCSSVLPMTLFLKGFISAEGCHISCVITDSSMQCLVPTCQPQPYRTWE